jgi:oligoribonuclease NrnB/cAMP/cGMP phosphodiesterase (DHH superfamily)
MSTQDHPNDPMPGDRLPKYKKPICIYHGNCADGFTAAWAVWLKHPNWEFFAATYGDPPPDVVDRKVVMVDFAYDYETLQFISEAAESVIILDHHESRESAVLNALSLPNVTGTYSKTMSGAMLAWREFHPEHEEIPELVRYVQDYDLWRFEFAATRKVSAYIFSHEYSFDVWAKLAWVLENNFEAAVLQGEAIDRSNLKNIKELVKAQAYEMILGGAKVWVVNLPYTMANDACRILLEEHQGLFAACYTDFPGERRFNLRSNDKGMNVADVAKRFGGGGHEHSAGFKVKLELQSHNLEGGAL